jgi:GNAT superfamily N-acetyltransferase
MSLEIRPWQPGDEGAILELFQAAFGRSLSAAFWKWRFLDHPAGPPLIMLAWMQGRLVSHYAASQCPMIVEGNPVRAALSMTSMTHPEFRSMGLFEKTGHALYEQLRAQGYAMTWGFPNANINVHRQRKLGWRAISDVATLSLALAQWRGGNDSPAEVQQAEQIDARFQRHAARLVARGAGLICGARDAATLAWRIDRNPVNRYIRLVLPDGDEIRGYALLKRWNDSDLDIVDLSAEDAEATRLLLRAAVARAAALGCQRVNSWCLPQDSRRLHFEYIGLNAGAPVTYMGGHPLTPDLQGFDDPRRWRISMLDSDLY